MNYVLALRIETGSDNKEELLSILDKVFSTFKYIGPAIIAGSAVIVKTQSGISYRVQLDRTGGVPTFVFPQGLNEQRILDTFVNYHLPLVANEAPRFYR